MRLICPNCDAQYEVDAALIPETGRDVQCSNCGKTWFHEPREALRLAAATEGVTAAEPEEGASGAGLDESAAAFFGAGSDGTGADEGTARAHEPDEFHLYDEREDLSAVTQPAEADAREVPAEAAADAADTDETEADEDEDEDEEAAPIPEGGARPARPELDAAVLGILKAEAEREIAARRAEAAAMESQPDLGLAEPDARRESVAAREAEARAGAAEEEAPPDPARRKALLPDVEEINSTLTATSDRAASDRIVDEEPAEVTLKRRSGFRLGFSVVMLATAALIFLYLLAPEIGQAVPALAPGLAAYVDWANGVRQSVDAYLQQSVGSLTNFLVRLAS